MNGGRGRKREQIEIRIRREIEKESKATVQETNKAKNIKKQFKITESLGDFDKDCIPS